MSESVKQHYLQFAYKQSAKKITARKVMDGCLPVNGNIPLPGWPKRWTAIDKIRMPDGAVYEVGLRRVR